MKREQFARTHEHTEIKDKDSVPSQPADPANFSLMDLINSLADPGPMQKRTLFRLLNKEFTTSSPTTHFPPVLFVRTFF